MNMYRYVDGVNESGAVYPRLIVLPVIKETKCGHRIRDDFNARNRFVLKTALKKFAHMSQDAAMISYKYRKSKQIRILEGRLNIARAALDAANTGTPIALPPMNLFT